MPSRVRWRTSTSSWPTCSRRSPRPREYSCRSTGERPRRAAGEPRLRAVSEPRGAQDLLRRLQGDRERSGRSCRRRPELRDHIKTYKRLSQLYAAVRQRYSPSLTASSPTWSTRPASSSRTALFRTGWVVFQRSLHSTSTRWSPYAGGGPGRRQGLQPLTRPAEGDGGGPGRCGGPAEASWTAASGSSQDLEQRKITGIAAMDELARWRPKRPRLSRGPRESGLSGVGFAVFWVLEQDDIAKAAGVRPMAAAKEIETLLAKFPNWRENADEKRQSTSSTSTSRS